MTRSRFSGKPNVKTRTTSPSSFPYSNSEIEGALAPWRPGTRPTYARKGVKVTDPEFPIIMALAMEGAKIVKGRRAGGARLRKTSGKVTQRLEALIEVYRSCPPKLQAHPMGNKTIERLRKGIIAKLGLRDEDHVLSEDTIKSDVRLVRPLLRLVQKGIIPRGTRVPNQGPSPQTKQEMARGAAALRKDQATEKRRKGAKKGAKKSPPIDPLAKIPRAVRSAVAVAESHYK